VRGEEREREREEEGRGEKGKKVKEPSNVHSTG
jgi:hypothetical protein